MDGLPFYKLYEELSGISGNFNIFKSIAQINGKMDQIVTTRTIQINGKTAQQPVGLANTSWPFREFPTFHDLVKDSEAFHIHIS